MEVVSIVVPGVQSGSWTVEVSSGPVVVVNCSVVEVVSLVEVSINRRSRGWWLSRNFLNAGLSSKKTGDGSSSLLEFIS